MAVGNAHSKPALGFLTVLDHPQHGLFGGYLLLNLAGRPLEFHCTAPIKPNRAQQILYGPTLESFLYGEQIGGTLLEHAKIEPLAVCTDCEPVLSIRDLISLPVALVLPSAGAAPSDAASTEAQAAAENDPEENSASTKRRALRLDAAHPRGPRLVTFELGRNRLAVAQKSSDDRQRITERLAEVAESLDFSEPFTRIREAIEEAQQAVR
jgi:hypothetical protein